MFNRIRDFFVRRNEPIDPPLTPEDHRELDDAARLLVDALRAADPELICEVARADETRVVSLAPPNPELRGLRLALDRREVRVELGDAVHWRRRRGEDPEADAVAAAAVLEPLIQGREFVALRRLGGRVVESGLGSLDAGVTGLWPEAMTRDRLAARGEDAEELTTELQGWLGPLPEAVTAGLRNRPPSESQARLEELASGPAGREE